MPNRPPMEVPHTDLHELRQKLNMTLDEFAEAYGLGFNTLRQWSYCPVRRDTSARILLALIAKDPTTIASMISDLRNENPTN